MEIRTYLDIAAPPSRVWDVLTDFAGYDRWNPMLRKMRGKPEVGAKVSFVAAAGGIRLPLTAEVVVAAPGRELMWIGPAAPRWMRRVLSGEHWFRLEPTAGGTRLDHGEVFRGATMPVRWDRLERALRPAYEQMNEKLRQQVEA